MRECIESQRTPSQRYPQVWVGEPKRVMPLHRVVWMMANGGIPEGLMILHRCGNSRCIRLDHLYAGTPTENMQDRLTHGTNPNLTKTHCPQGHEYSPQNTTRGRGSQGRKCKECRRAYEERKRRLRGVA